MSYVDFSLVSPLGDALQLRTSADQPGAFGLLVGASGLGLADRDVKLSASSGDGGRVRSVRVPPRPATIPVLVWGEDEADRTANIRRLAAAVRMREGSPSPKLVATYASGEVFELPFVYESGADKIGRQIGAGGVEVPLNVIFPDPFWTARDARQVDVTGTSTPVGLLPDLAALKLSPSNASGTMPIQNDGEARTYPVWRIVGPATKVEASLGGRGWSLAPVAVGETITIDTKTNAVTLADGTNVYDRLGTAPKLFYLPTGRSDVAVTITGAAGGDWSPVGPVLRTNLATNPVPGSTTGYSGPGTASVSTMSDGTPCFEVTTTTTTTPYAFSTPSASAVTAGETYVMSAMVEIVGDTAGASYTIRGHGTTGNVYFASGSTTILASAGPTRVTIVCTPNANVAAGEFNFSAVRGAATGPGIKVRLGKVQIEKASTWDPTLPYFDGSFGYSAGGACVWTGTPGLSTSTYSASQLVGQSAVSCFYKPRMEVVL